MKNLESNGKSCHVDFENLFVFVTRFYALRYIVSMICLTCLRYIVEFIFFLFFIFLRKRCRQSRGDQIKKTTSLKPDDDVHF